MPTGLALAFVSLLAGCSAAPAVTPFATPTPGVPQHAIRHVVIVVQENRSFDNLFATFPGADGTRSGRTHDGRRIDLHATPLVVPYDLDHTSRGYLTGYANGAMNGFDRELDSAGTPAGTLPYAYVDPRHIRPYWELARQYVLADHTFSTQGSDSFTAHQDLIAGGTAIDAYESIIDLPSLGGRPWGCDAPKGTVTSLITKAGLYLYNAGPFPCFHYKTLRDVLDAKRVSWKYYTPKLGQAGGAFWNAFDAIAAVRYGPQWRTNVVEPDTAIFGDIHERRLPAVSWVIPQASYSDHPGERSDDGPSWVAQIVNAVGKSPYWDETAIVVVWDEWGGLYDHVPPPQREYGGLGMRVPMLVVSPYARRGAVSHTQYEFGSILRFVEETFGLDRIGSSDVRAASIADCFDFTQAPRPFVAIPATRSLQYFLTTRFPALPVDDR